MNRIITITTLSDIFPEYQNTPIGLLLEYHNLDRPPDTYSRAQLLIGMCMDHRKRLDIPDNFAYIIRTGGANLRHSEFKVSFAIAVGGVKTIAIIGHTNCGMVNLISKKDQFIRGLVENGGWEQAAAAEHFDRLSPSFEIGDEVDFVLRETNRLRLQYPSILVAPLLYRVEDNRLNLIQES